MQYGACDQPVLDPPSLPCRSVKIGDSWDFANVYPGVAEHAHLVGYSMQHGDRVAAISATFDGPNTTSVGILLPSTLIVVFDLDKGVILSRTKISHVASPARKLDVTDIMALVTFDGTAM